METLEEIDRTDNKQRYSFSEDRTLIRANQGHSITVDVELPVAEPLDAGEQICVLPVGERRLADEGGSGELSGEGIEKSVFGRTGVGEQQTGQER